MNSLAVPAGKAPYPVSLTADYPERQSRWKALFRLPLSIPVLLFLVLLSWALYVAIWVMWVAILIRGRVPRWIFDFAVGAHRALLRARAYPLLLTDQYPPFEGDHPVHYEVAFPDRASRWRLVLWKLITSVPHLIVLQTLSYASLAIAPIAWISIIITGRFPRGLHEFAVGILRWSARVEAYLFSLTDEFPPFSLSSAAGRAGRDTYAICSVVGVLLTAVLVGGITTLAVLSRGDNAVVVRVSYDDLLNGRVTAAQTSVLSDDEVLVTLTGAKDPDDSYIAILKPEEGRRFVGFQMTTRDFVSRRLRIAQADFKLKDTRGNEHRPFLAIVNGRTLPETLGRNEDGTIDLLFELDNGIDPAELRYQMERIAYSPFAGDPSVRPIAYRFTRP